MKVLLVNGSPHEKGCTYAALCEVAKALNDNGVETEIYHIGKKPIAGCLGCGAWVCGKSQDRRRVRVRFARVLRVGGGKSRQFYEQAVLQRRQTPCIQTCGGGG